MSESGLSLGDVLGVAGLVLALISPLSVVLYRTRKKMYAISKDLKSAEAEIEDARAVIELMAESRARGLVATSTCFDALAGAVHRILLKRTDEIDVSREIHELRLTRRGVERAAMEARLFGSGEVIALRSALQQLTFQLGDAESIELCRDLARARGTRAISPADLELAAAELTRRLADQGPLR